MINRPLNTPGDLLAYDPSGGDAGEITLAEIVSAFTAHWRMIAALTLTGLLLAGGWVLMNEPEYVFRSSIEIGTTVDENTAQTPRLIDSPATVLAKLQENYIPLARAEYARGHPGQQRIPRVTARLPEASELLVLESVGPRGDADQHRAMHAAVVELLARDHRRSSVLAKNILETRRAEAERQLQEVHAQPGILADQAVRLEAARKVLARQVTELRDSLAAGTRTRREADSVVKDESRVLSLLVFDQEIQNTRSQLAQMEERLYVTLPAELDDIKKAIADNNRSEVVQRRLIDQVAVEIANLKETRALAPALRSTQSIGKRGRTVLAIGGGFGLILGVLLALGSDLTRRAQTHRRSPARG